MLRNFTPLVPAATVDEKGLRRIILESPGGEVVEAVRIAKIIRDNNFVTLVGGECASACAMVLYPAGRYSYLFGKGKLGFHSCYDERTSIEHSECTDAIAKLAASNGFPYGSIKVFASLAGPADMHWITNILAYCYGMEHPIGDPAPITVSTLCPTVAQVVIDAKFREPNRPLGPSFDCKKARTPPEFLLCRDAGVNAPRRADGPTLQDDEAARRLQLFVPVSTSTRMDIRARQEMRSYGRCGVVVREKPEGGTMLFRDDDDANGRIVENKRDTKTKFITPH